MTLMGDNKTKPTEAKVEEFLASIENEQRRKDGLELLHLMREITKERPVMWGQSIVGFGDYHYKYASGREGDWFKTGFSPRKSSLTLYIMPNLDEFKPLLAKLGKHRTGKGCVYISKLSDVDISVLREIIEKSIQRLPQG